VSVPGAPQRSWASRDGRPEVGREGGWGGGRGHAGGSGRVGPPRPTEPARPRILLAKPGLDGHDRGLKVIAFALRDAGTEVIYLGLRQSPAAIVAAAVAEDADLIGISVLSGAHLPLAEQILAHRAEQGAGHIPVAMGGTIPAEHADRLREMGVAAVYPAGSLLPEVVNGLLGLASRAAAPEKAPAARAAAADDRGELHALYAEKSPRS
jgi:methylmalonyl-CoA mutase, C-terminal domain